MELMTATARTPDAADVYDALRYWDFTAAATMPTGQSGFAESTSS